jgi:peptidoglycan/LPS O-acetylase OafA/YrhL
MRLISNVIMIGFAALAAFQVALVAGAPLGHAAWGGAHAHLTTNQRIGSAAAVAIYVAAIFVVRGRAAGRAKRRYRWTTWALGPLLGLGAVANFASDSSWENYLLAPIAVVLAALCLVLAVKMHSTEDRRGRAFASPFPARRPHLPV